MDAQRPYNEAEVAQTLFARLLNLPPLPRHETAGGLSTRMIIDSASYSTTPCSSPPSERCHVFSAHDTHQKVPDGPAVTEAGHVLEHQRHQHEILRYISGAGAAYADMPAVHISPSSGPAQSDRTKQYQGIIPPYMLRAIATSDAAGPGARASAEQTLRSSKPVTHNRASNWGFTLTAPAQRQLKDGTWATAA